MPHYTMVEELRPRGQRFVERIHRMRMLGTTLCMLPIASVLWEQAAAAHFWVLLMLNAFVWPQIALLASRRARDPVEAEFRCLVLDSTFGGAWIAVMGVSAAPTGVFIAMLTADKVAAGGWRLLIRSSVALIGGFALAWTLLGFPFQPVTSTRTLLACFPFLFIYALALSTLAQRLRSQVVAQNRELHMLARIDPVMQVPNRPHFEALAAQELSRFHRSGRPVSMLLVDVDHFKVINDRHGHGMGDIVLKRVAAILREAVREIDLPARYGGDEFAVLLVDTDRAAAIRVAERLRQQVAQEVFADKPGLTCSLSIGVAQATREHRRLDAWVQATDASLYRAKAAGRNHVDGSREPAAPLTVVNGARAA